MMVMMQPRAINLVQFFIGIEFFKKNILPKAWYHLIKNGVITEPELNKFLINLKKETEIEISMKEIKQYLFYCIAKVSLKKKMIEQHRRALLQTIRATFSMQPEQFKELYMS